MIVGFLLFSPDKLVADGPVDESLAEAFATATASTSPVTTGSTTPATTFPSVAPTAAGPTSLGTEQFTGIGHLAAGTATIYEENGRFVLRFEDDTDIQNGPDLYVWVLAGNRYEGGTPSTYLDLGNLKGNVGGQNYGSLCFRFVDLI